MRRRRARGRCARRALRIIASGVPAAMSRPPASPPSGPRSMIQSAARMTSRLCSMTSSECPAASSRSKAPSSFATSWKCSPVVGSSNRNNNCGTIFRCRADLRSPRLRRRALRKWSCRHSSARWPASLSRCASPPESVGTGWPSRRYSSPTSTRGSSRWSTSSSPAKNSTASATVISSTSAMLRAGPSSRAIFTSRISGR